MNPKVHAKTLTVHVQLQDGALIRRKSMRITLPEAPTGPMLAEAREALEGWTASLAADLSRVA